MSRDRGLDGGNGSRGHAGPEVSVIRAEAGEERSRGLRGSYCVVIPTFNERASIRAVVDRLVATNLVRAIVVVDDGSRDGTLGELAGVPGTQAHLILVNRGTRKGIGSAIRDGLALGLRTSTATRFAHLDGDLSHLPEQLHDLDVADADVVIGSRYAAGGAFTGISPWRKVVSFGANKLVRSLFGIPVHDATSGFRTYSRRAAESVALSTRTTGFEFFVESLLVARRRNFTVQERAITFMPRKAGSSKLGVRAMFKFLQYMVTSAG